MSEIGTTAIRNTALLDAVAQFRSVFFSSNRACYDVAKSRWFRLVPPTFLHIPLEHDYEQVAAMLFGEIPRLQDILAKLAYLEAWINE